MPATHNMSESDSRIPFVPNLHTQAAQICGASTPLKLSKKGRADSPVAFRKVIDEQKMRNSFQMQKGNIDAIRCNKNANQYIILFGSPIAFNVRRIDHCTVSVAILDVGQSR